MWRSQLNITCVRNIVGSTTFPNSPILKINIEAKIIVGVRAIYLASLLHSLRAFFSSTGDSILHGGITSLGIGDVNNFP